MTGPVWPKRIVFGHADRTPGNGRKTGLRRPSAWCTRFSASTPRINLSGTSSRGCVGEDEGCGVGRSGPWPCAERACSGLLPFCRMDEACLSLLMCDDVLTFAIAPKRGSGRRYPTSAEIAQLELSRRRRLPRSGHQAPDSRIQAVSEHRDRLPHFGASAIRLLIDFSRSSTCKTARKIKSKAPCMMRKVE
jgi:hypothetical protein